MAVVLVFGTAAAAARRFVDFHFGVPGHTGVAWMAVLVFGYLAARRRGAGTGIGLTSAVMSGPLGLGHSFTYNLLIFGLAGLLVDLVFALPQSRLGTVVVGALAGATAHMAKFGVVVGNVLIGGGVKHVAIVGLGVGALNHLLFGLVGGLLGAGLYLGGREALRRLRS